MENMNFEDLSEEKKELIILNASDEKKQKDFFEKFRKKVDDFVKEHPRAKFVEYIMILPDLFYLVCRLFGDSRVPTKNKLHLGIAIVYCISPIDILPDLIPGGFTDDAILLIKTLSDLINSVDNEIIQEHWAGEENIIKVIKELTEIVSDFLDKDKIATKLSKIFDSLRDKWFLLKERGDSFKLGALLATC